MKIEQISNEEFEKLFFKRKGKKSVLFKTLISMKKDECVRFDKTIIRGPNQLSRVLYYIRKNYKFEFSGGRLSDDSGWAYKRVK